MDDFRRFEKLEEEHSELAKQKVKETVLKKRKFHEVTQVEDTKVAPTKKLGEDHFVQTPLKLQP